MRFSQFSCLFYHASAFPTFGCKDYPPKCGAGCKHEWHVIWRTMGEPSVLQQASHPRSAWVFCARQRRAPPWPGHTCSHVAHKAWPNQCLGIHSFAGKKPWPHRLGLARLDTSKANQQSVRMERNRRNSMCLSIISMAVAGNAFHPSEGKKAHSVPQCTILCSPHLYCHW